MSPATSSVMFSTRYILLLLKLRHNFVNDKLSYKLIAIFAALDTLTQFLHMQFHFNGNRRSNIIFCFFSKTVIINIYRFINYEIFGSYNFCYT